MHIIHRLTEKEAGVSFEFFPPKTPDAKGPFIDVVTRLRQFDPFYVSVTYGAGGTTRERTRETIGWIQEESDLTVMAHLTGIGSTRKEIEDILIDYKTRGIDNVLVLRGDPPRNVPGFDLARGAFAYAEDLVRFVKKHGDFCISVAVYPEGHQESPNLEKDIEYTKRKIDAGADFAITQMFFDNRYFYDFVERAERADITIPILPGIMPITDCRRIVEFATFCSATIPRDLLIKMEHIQDDTQESFKLGVDHGVRQCEDLMGNGVRYLHFYTLNKAEAVSDIIGALPLLKLRE
ncbi:MAG TPA: methylenetetrahydrofolate reductase [NAD(P)H] [Dissulfurispiraceae bacterium]|nr:methylenetetrahydrofolate reductase [NAD(P)H] [Dissulfurispiraceae bacterium]